MLLLILIFFLSIILPLLLWGTFLRVGLRWAKVEDVPVMKLVQVLILTIAIESLVFLALSSLETIEETKAAILAIGLLAISFLLQPAIIKWVFKTTFLRSLQAWVTTFLMPLILVPLSLYIVKPYLFEAFISPVNSMAPTILGTHQEGKCKTCGNLAFGSAPHPEYHVSKRMICEKNFHISEPPDDDQNFDPTRELVSTNNNIQIFSGDWVIATKFLKPKRWDVVIFKLPSDPDTFFVKRLVGMPGEEITIHDGFVYADGKKLIPPESINGIKYENIPIQHGKEMWGSPENPAKLASDEYFMLGDFSRQSADSRIWEKGAAGHPPYAVPQSHLVGVVTHIYWPPKRWRFF